MKRHRPFDSATRRHVLKTTGLIGAIAGTGGIAAGQETTPGGGPSPQETPTATAGATPILLGGEVSHWFGLMPEPIHGTENPTLALRAGETYRLVWMNLDGVEHELIIEDANGNELVATESATRAGATRTVTFTASQRMSQYYCEYHPQSMRGDVEIGAGFTTTTGTTERPTASDGGGTGY